VSQLWADYLLEKGLQAFNTFGVVHQIESNFIGTSFLRLGESSLYYITDNSEVSPESAVQVWYNGFRVYNTSELQKSIDRQPRSLKGG